MNIGIVTTWFERGAAYVSRQYANVLSKQNNVFIFARGGEKYAQGEKEWDDKWKVYWASKIDGNKPTYFSIIEFEKWIKENSIECVLFNEQHWWQPIIFCNTHKIKCGAYIDYYTEETIPFFQCYDFLICNTKRHYNVFKNHKQAFYIPWGTSINIFKNVNYNLVTENKVTFFHSAGYNPERKGTKYLIKAFEKLSCKYKNQSLLVIHTQVELKKYCPDIEDVLEKNKNIKVICETVPAPGLFHLGDVYVYPSILDGLGLTVTEAFSCGLPVIMTDNAPMTEFGNKLIRRKIKVKEFHTRKDAYYWPVAELSIQSLFKQMEYYILKMEDIPEMKKKAREYALEKLDWEKNANKLNNIICNTSILNHNKKIYQNITYFDNSTSDIESAFNIYRKKIEHIEKVIGEYSGKDMFFYPGGEQTKKILKYVNLKNIIIRGVIDTTQKKIEGYMTNNCEILKKYSYAVVVVTSWKYSEEIKEQINKIKTFKGTIVNLFNYEYETL